jgi:hypothetical protein
VHSYLSGFARSFNQDTPSRPRAKRRIAATQPLAPNAVFARLTHGVTSPKDMQLQRTLPPNVPVQPQVWLWEPIAQSVEQLTFNQ